MYAELAHGLLPSKQAGDCFGIPFAPGLERQWKLVLRPVLAGFGKVWPINPNPEPVYALRVKRPGSNSQTALGVPATGSKRR